MQVCVRHDPATALLGQHITAACMHIKRGMGKKANSYAIRSCRNKLGNLKCPPTGEWAGKLWYSHRMEYYIQITVKDIKPVYQHGWLRNNVAWKKRV